MTWWPTIAGEATWPRKARSTKVDWIEIQRATSSSEGRGQGTVKY